MRRRARRELQRREAAVHARLVELGEELRAVLGPNPTIAETRRLADQLVIRAEARRIMDSCT